MKMELENSIFQLESSEESLTSKMNQTSERISGLEDKSEGKQMVLIVKKKHRKGACRKCGHYQKTKSSTYRQNWGRRIPGQW